VGGSPAGEPPTVSELAEQLRVVATATASGHQRGGADAEAADHDGRQAGQVGTGDRQRRGQHGAGHALPVGPLPVGPLPVGTLPVGGVPGVLGVTGGVEDQVPVVGGLVGGAVAPFRPRSRA
jgi:hypothetical protein